MLAEARGLLGADFHHGEAVEFDIEIEGSGDAFEVHVEVEGEGTEGERRLRMGSCQQAREAIALVIALALDPELATRRPPEPQPATEPPAEAQPPPAPLQWELALPSVGLDTSLLPTAAPSLGGHVALRQGPFRLAFGFAYLVPSPVRVQSIRTGTSFEVNVDAVTVGAGLCWEALEGEAWRLGPCGGLWLGRISARAQVPDAEGGGELALAPTLGAGAAYRLSSLLGLRLDGRLLVPLAPPRFEVREDVTVHPVGSMSVQAELSLVFRL